MDRFKRLNRYQQALLLLMAAMILIFGVIYAVVSSRIGFLYQNQILVPREENGNTIYSGRIHGRDSEFLVSSDGMVQFRWGENQYGPFRVTEAPDAVPQDHPWTKSMTGLEIREGERVLFRGGAVDLEMQEVPIMLIDEEGSDLGVSITVTMGDGRVLDADGNEIDPMKPTVSTIARLSLGPELTKKGEWLAWFLGLLLSGVNAVSILYADELFRWNLSFRIRDPERAEPTEWEIVGRYVGWTGITIMILVLYIMGLR